jgi:hypothetical protein
MVTGRGEALEAPPRRPSGAQGRTPCKHPTLAGMVTVAAQGVGASYGEPFQNRGRFSEGSCAPRASLAPTPVRPKKQTN